jgi:hypothetical protein
MRAYGQGLACDSHEFDAFFSESYKQLNPLIYKQISRRIHFVHAPIAATPARFYNLWADLPCAGAILISFSRNFLKSIANTHQTFAK